ncbi:Universal stress protein family protein [Halogranum gelatinilyticum]|uniref:Universal stress protein family protein n=1 Tax=Halogranum gelatinilyticum TaxID=660521 RepID=A0A1G9YWX0_9EURY|nr:universal stress protein [Halogranum gelatinilyticum]SDN13659.1 Universal stress protein family protein [Halogranum gelatinilyticum]
MTDAPSDRAADMTVLVPVRILEGQQIPAALIDVLVSTPVVLLGYHPIPEQTAPEQARTAFGEQARAELDQLAQAFTDAGGSVETRLVFTHDPTQTFERVAADEAADAVLLLNPAPSVDRILVALSEGINTERITRLVALLAGYSDRSVTLFHAAATEEDRERGEQLLDTATDLLVERGVPPGAITRDVTVSDAPVQAIVDAAAGTDLVVLGESRPSVRELIFGEPSERVAGHSLAPILVVRRLPALDAESDVTAASDTPDGDDA